MKTKFLQNLGLTKEQIDLIMKENGKDIASEQGKVVTVNLERNHYKKQLETVQAIMKEFEEIDLKNLQEKIYQLTDDLKIQKRSYENQAAEIEFYLKLETALKACQREKIFLFPNLTPVQNTVSESKSKYSNLDLNTAMLRVMMDWVK